MDDDTALRFDRPDWHQGDWHQAGRHQAGPRIAVIIPCYNEAVAVPKVIADFRRALPHATIYVYDNNSHDGTAEAARESGAASATRGCRARAMSSAAPSPIWKPTSMFWWTATTPMTPRPPPPWCAC